VALAIRLKLALVFLLRSRGWDMLLTMAAKKIQRHPVIACVLRPRIGTRGLYRYHDPMHDVAIAGSDDDGRLFNQILAHYGAPAYIRRARQVEDAFDQLVNQCARQRREWLKTARSRLSVACSMTNDNNELLPLLADASQLLTIAHLCAQLDVVSIRREGHPSVRSLRRQLQELRMSIVRFNQRWLAYLEGLDLTGINQLRDAYNRYHLLEKECAMRSARLARQYYRPLDPVTAERLLVVFPLLPVPELRK
jgi:hypothetical protein